MTRRKWLWAALVGVPVAVVGGFAYANVQKPRGYTCPITGENLPCPDCCPLNGAKPQAETGDAYTCPITGEQLPCEKCCPLNGAKAGVKTEAKTETKKEDAQPYICPITGEELGCPNCCPLNKAKK